MRLFDIKGIQLREIKSAVEQYIQSITGSVPNQSTVMGQLIQVVSTLVMNVLSYIEDAFSEQNKYTATRRKSIYNLAVLSGYEPHLGRPAMCQAIFELKTNNEGTEYVVANHSTFVNNKNGVAYVLLTEGDRVLIGPDNRDMVFDLCQGVWETQSLFVEGELYTNLTYQNYIYKDSIEVRFQGEPLEHLASPYDKTDKPGWCISLNPLNGLDLRVYNVQGNVEVSYIRHNGSQGNIPEGSKFSFIQPITNLDGDPIDGNSVLEVRPLGDDYLLTGTDPEDTNQVRDNIGFSSRSLVLADSSNYQHLLSMYSFVGYSKTWSEPGGLHIRSLIMANHRLTGKSYWDLDVSDFLLSNQQKNSIKHALQGRQLAGSIYDIVDPDIWKYSLFVYIRPNGKVVDRAIMTADIKDRVAKLFTNIQSDRYIPQSDIMDVIREVPGVDGVSIYILSERNELAIQTGEHQKTSYIWNNKTGLYNKVTKTIRVFAGENPLLGLDQHGNILLEDQRDFPVLMGGWRWRNDQGDLVTAEPITIHYEG